MMLWVIINTEPGSNNKIFEGRKNFECYQSNKILETNIVFWNWNTNFSLLFLPLFSTFIIFIYTFDY